MSKLHAVVENLDDVPESMHDFYSEAKDKDDKVSFVLQLEDDVKGHPLVGALHRAHEAQKQTNRDLKVKLAEAEKKVEGLPENFDPEELVRLRELEAQIKEKGTDDPKAKKAHEAEIQSVKKMHEQQLAKILKQMQDGFKERDDKVSGLNGKVQQMVVHDGLTRVLVEGGVKKDALPFVTAKLEKSIKVSEEDGEFVPMVDTDLGPLPLEQFISKWLNSDEAKLFVEQPKGGDATGGGRKGISDANPWSAPHWDMSRQAEIIKKDIARADRFAKNAGHKRALGALRMDAK